MAFSRRFLSLPSSEPSLFECTSSRWLFDEAAHLAARRVSFNIDALKEAACQAAQATRCMSFRKIAEGYFNKVYLIGLDTGAEVIARIPHPIAGPPRYVIASEVATMDYLRTVLHLPVPRVLSWSASNDRVGSAYIIMEKVEGSTLKMRMQSLPPAHEFRDLVISVLEMETSCLHAVFSQYGSLYYKEDVSPELQRVPLYADFSQIKDGADRFRIGPSTNRAFWCGERESMDLDRGPWRLPEDYLAAAARSEIDWIIAHARARAYIDYERTDDPPAAHIDMLERYIRAVKAPGVAPAQHPIFRPTIWHPDLNTANIITTPGANNMIELRGLIDWQHTCIIPACLQPRTPTAFTYLGNRITMPVGASLPTLPDNYDSLAPDAKSEVDWELSLATVSKVYTLAAERHALRSRIAQMPHRDALGALCMSAGKCWDEGYSRLRFWLAKLQAAWPGSSDCPIGFSDEEIDGIADAYSQHKSYDLECEPVMEELECADDGEMEGATQEQVDAARARCAEAATQWDEAVYGGPFPIRAGSSGSIATTLGRI
ncbi:hypothetical protein BOTBODRAFT_158856 [Botryobasidium botryosum FD-172 SS1]|uniref:Aminoglycoside phosphotransferase domain-containing protein n=1 Tax=Botryobasidium botryosum (strain FD-172 SS1) TaxID=930990 RepID=A0A067MJH0_BOTB1|nr:hypothetical protein BOTBODRAFT_158856 [Botryobasidium botryosum FD-172 SS1]